MISYKVIFLDIKRHLSRARKCIARGEITLALQNYFLHFSNTSESSWDEAVIEEFVDLICDLKIFFCIEPSITVELSKSLSKAIHLFPNNCRLWNLSADINNIFRSQKDFTLMVFKAFKIAESNNLSCLAIERKMLDVMWWEVPRWHFRMLNGKLRNTAYKTAIHKALQEGYTTAADIGAGCGLLSLYLASHPSKPTITLFESDETFYNLAISNLQHFSPDIILDSHPDNSKNVTQTKFKSNLLVTEIFDVAFFGEGIISTLIHSLKWHIDNRDFKIIPAKVNIFVTGVSSESLGAQYRVQRTIPTVNVSEDIRITKNMEGDPYDAENLLKYNFVILTETTEVMELDLKNREMLEFIHRNKWGKYISLKGIREGNIDCLVVWFDLHLDDEIWISTNPFHEANEPCWEQAIFYCRSPFKIEKNQEIPLSVKIIREHLEFEFSTQNIPKIPEFTLEEISLKFLNDEKWTEFLVNLTQNLTEPATVCDFSSFPLFGLILAKRGFRVIHVTENYFDTEKLVHYLLQKNEIDVSLFTMYNRINFAPYLVSEERIDYVFYEPVDSGGRLRQSPLDNVVFKKFNATNFFTDIIIHFELIHSSYLDYCNKVSEENVEPFKHLADSLNVFTGSEHPCLPHDFPREKMSNELAWNTKESSKVLTAEILKDGKINAISTWFTIVGLGNTQFCTEKSTYFNLNALLVPERKVRKNENLSMVCRFEKGDFFKIEISEEKKLETVSSKNGCSPFIKNFYSTYCDKYL